MTSIDCSWPRPPSRPQLAPGEIHVWCLPLDLPDDCWPILYAGLSDDERERADRFRFDHLRRRFIVCRGGQRAILGSYLDAAPERLCFRYEPRGKPHLDGPWRDAAIQFNVSNSGEVGLLALAVARPLGVDVEHVRPLSNMRGMAERYFAPAERQQLFELPVEQQTTAFFNCWTRKEAVLKATGLGLFRPLESVVVSLAPYAPACVVACAEEGPAAEEWWLSSLEPARGYIAAVASPGGAAEVRQWLWRE